MNLLFTTPISRPSFDGGTSVTGMTIISCQILPDPPISAVVVVRAIEDGVTGSPHTFTIGPFTGATTLTQILAALKTQAASTLGVTFQ